MSGAGPDEEAAPPRFTAWPLWPVLAWAVPAWFPASRWLAGNVVDAQLATVAALVFVPVLGLCGMGPRRTLRRRGFREVPTEAGAAMIVSWCAGAMYPLFYRMPFAVSPPPTFAFTLSGGTLPAAAEPIIGIVLLVAAAAALIIAGEKAANAPLPEPIEATRPAGTGTGAGAGRGAGGRGDPARKASARMRRARTLGAAALLPPVLVVGGCLSGIGIAHAFPDAAGDMPWVALSRPMDEQVALVEARYAAARIEDSSIRQRITSSVMAPVEHPSPAAAFECVDRRVDCYRFVFGGQVSDADLVEGFDVHELRASLSADGWHVEPWRNEHFSATRDDGSWFEFFAVDWHGSQYQYNFSTGSWYGDPDQLAALLRG